MNGEMRVEVTPEERAALYFIPQAVGGKVVAEEMQQRLQDKGLATPPREDGRRWLTENSATAFDWASSSRLLTAALGRAYAAGSRIGAARENPCAPMPVNHGLRVPHLADTVRNDTFSAWAG